MLLAMPKKKSPRKAKAKTTAQQLENLTSQYWDLFGLMTKQMIAFAALRQLLVEHELISSSEIDRRLEHLSDIAHEILHKGLEKGEVTKDVKDLSKLLAEHKGPIQ